jgi:hypothetical protein
MDRFTSSIVAGVLLLVAVGLGATVVLRDRQQPPDLSQPGGVVLAYALAEQRGDQAAAWDLLAPSAQARTTRDRFIARAGSDGTNRAFLSTEDIATEGDSARVALLRTYPASGGLFGTSSYTDRSTVVLERQPSGWRITIPSDDYLLNADKH